jgi:hypothetical protein
MALLASSIQQALMPGITSAIQQSVQQQVSTVQQQVTAVSNSVTEVASRMDALEVQFRSMSTASAHPPFPPAVASAGAASGVRRDGVGDDPWRQSAEDRGYLPRGSAAAGNRGGSASSNPPFHFNAKGSGKGLPFVPSKLILKGLSVNSRDPAKRSGLTEEAALGLWDSIKAGFLDKEALSIVVRASAPHTFMNWQVVLHCSPDARPYDLEKLKMDLNTHIKSSGITVPGLDTQPYVIVEDSPDSKARKAAVARAGEVLESVGKFRPHR